MPPFVALTGGIGAGKSTALAALERLGAATLSSDAVVHQLYERQAVQDAVAERFGPDVVVGGTVDRGALARRAFASDENREWLEQMLWPLVRQEVDAWRDGIAADRVARGLPAPRALVVEVPLVFESGGEAQYDATITVIADEQVRRARALARGQQAVAAREARQLSQQEKAARSTFVVENDAGVPELEHKLAEILAMLDA